MEAPLIYGNWIRRRNLLILGAGAVLTGAVFLLPVAPGIRLLAVSLFLLVLISFLIPFYAYVMFSHKGGNLQESVYNLNIQRLGKEMQGSLIDIG